MFKPNQTRMANENKKHQPEDSLFPLTTNEQNNPAYQTSDHEAAQFDFVTQAGTPSKPSDADFH